MADTKASFLWAIKQQESGGNYNSVNSGSGALGAYQVMPENVASWTQQALGHSLSASQFLNNPSAQDAVANNILGGYYDKYGSDGAAAMWYSGQPDPTKTYGSPSVSDYVNQVKSRMTSNSPVDSVTEASGLPNPLDAIPNPLDVPGDLAKGLEQGMTSALKAAIMPTLKWATWVASAGVGIGLMVGGAFLMIRSTSVYKSANQTKKNIAVDAIPEAKVAKKVAAAKKTTAPNKSYFEQKQARQQKSAMKAQTPKDTNREFEKRRIADVNKRMKAGRKQSE